LAEFPLLPSKLPTYAQTVTASSLKSQTRSNDSSSNSQSQASSPSQINLSKCFPSPHLAESLQIIKTSEVNIFPVEQQIAHIQNPTQVVFQMFSPGWYFQLEHHYKTQTFYEFILVDTNSILLTHNKCKWDSSRTVFSKCVIKNVISPLQWNGSPWDQRKFSQTFSPPSYNYYDYQNAWYNAFYFQNDRFQHSWFFYFEKHLEIQNHPAWFHHWWFQFGSKINGLLIQIENLKTKLTLHQSPM
jgi:hypothetical protein